jgi:F-type H+-transporting ATPase subunit delta
LSVQKIAKRYAFALYEVSEEATELEAVSSDLQELEDMLVNHVELASLVVNPTYTSVEKEAVFLDLHAKLAKKSETTLNFIKLLAKKKRFENLAEIIKAFRSLMDEKANILDAYVESASELSSSQDKFIQSYLEKSYKKTIRLTKVVNPSLGGGCTILVGDQLIDFSIENQLVRLKKQLIAG